MLSRGALLHGLEISRTGGQTRFTNMYAVWDELPESLKQKVSFIAEVLLDPGENEMAALAAGAMRYFRGAEKLATY